MKFLTRRVFSLGTIVLLHVTFSLAVIMTWTAIKRDWDFSKTSFSNENSYVSGDTDEFNAAAVVISAQFRYLHFNHLVFYLFNIAVSATTVIVFFNLARSGLGRKLSLYVTALFAFNPEFVFYNNFVLKENMLILVVVVAMYFFFRSLATNLLIYKILFCLLLPLIPLLRKPLILMGLLPLVFLPKCTKRLMFLSGIAAASGLFLVMLSSCWTSAIGNYGVTKVLFEDIYGVPTFVTFGTLFTSPVLFAEYFLRSLLYYIRPGWSAGIKLNSFLIPYTLFVVYVFLASFPYRKSLAPAYRTAYAFIALIMILVSVIFIVYDPVERYRYSVFQLAFTLLVLNLKGYQEHLRQPALEPAVGHSIVSRQAAAGPC